MSAFSGPVGGQGPKGDTGLNAGWVPLAETILIAAAASIDFQSISAAYRHLKLVADLRSSAALTQEGCDMRFNNDSGANYDWQGVYSFGTAMASEEILGGSAGRLGFVTAANAPANVSSGFAIDIFNYAATTFNKSYGSLGTNKRGTSTQEMLTQYVAGAWRSSAAINRVTILAASGNLAIGSMATLYGLGGV